MLLWLYYIEFKIQNPNGSIALTHHENAQHLKELLWLYYIEFKIQNPNGSIVLTHHQSG
jgi:hypothetical protein